MRGDEAQELAHDVKYAFGGTLCAIHDGTSHDTDF